MFLHVFVKYCGQPCPPLKQLLPTYELLGNLMTWSGLQRGTVDWRPQRVNLYEIIHRNLVLFIPVAEHKQIILKNVVPEAIFVYADPDMVYAVIRNLLSNALKFSFPGDRVTVSANLTETTVEIAVSDTGVGIGQEDLPKLFREDITFQTPGTDGEEGTGLGLLLCKELI